MTRKCGGFSRSPRDTVRGVNSNMPLEIHLTVQNANHVDSLGRDPEKQHVRSRRIFPVSRPDIVTGSGDFRIRRHSFNRALDLSQINFRLFDVPVFDRVFADIVNILPRARRKDVALHAAEEPFLSLRAMNRSKSNAVEGPLFSPSTSAARSAESFASCSSSSRSAARITSLALS